MAIKAPCTQTPPPHPHPSPVCLSEVFSFKHELSQNMALHAYVAYSQNSVFAVTRTVYQLSSSVFAKLRRNL